MKNLYAIHYKTSRPNNSHGVTAARFVKTIIVNGQGQLYATLETLTAQGCTINSVYNRCGERVKF